MIDEKSKILREAIFFILPLVLCQLSVICLASEVFFFYNEQMKKSIFWFLRRDFGRQLNEILFVWIQAIEPSIAK